MKKTVLFLVIFVFTASLAFGATVTIGTGTTEVTAGPFNNYWECNRSQMLYTSSEIGSAGTITSLKHYISFVTTDVTCRDFDNFTIKLKETSTTSFGTAYEDMTSATQVFFSADYNMPTATGWHEWDITDFSYGGSNNLIVEIFWGDNAECTGSADRYTVYGTSTSTNYCFVYGNSDSETPPSYDGRDYIRPNIQLEITTSGPGAPTSPSPANGAECIAVNSNPDISWTNPAGTVYNEVYFSTTESDVINKVVGARVLNGSPGTVYSSYNQASDLTNNTTYYWRVLETDGTGTTDGPVWSFTTKPQADSYPLTETFESNFDKFDNATGNDVDWTISTTYHHGGSKCAYNDYTVNDENILHETGILDLSGATKPMLYFCHIAKTEDGYDKCYVQISTDCGANYTILPSSCYEGDASGYSNPNEYFDEGSYTIWDPSGAIPDNSTWWKQETFDLSGYKQANVRFRFRLTSDGSGNEYGWLVDDIEVKEAPAKDIAVNSASIPLPADVWCYYQGGSYTVSAVIENRGTESDPSSVTLTYKEGSEPANENDGTKQVFTPSWSAKGSTATCAFTTQWSPASTGDKTMYVKAFYTGDGNSTNDSASKTVTVENQYTLLKESFEDTWETSYPYGPPNWSESNIAAGTTVGNSDWNRRSLYHQEGSYSAYVYFTSYSSDDDWLISPAIDLTANTSRGASQLSYWILFSSTLAAGDYLYVKISTDGGATWSATLKTYDNTNTSGMTSLTWQGIDLASYSAQSNVKIGFYGDSNSNGSCSIYMDVVQIKPAGPPDKPINPDPSDTDTDIAITTNLSWDDAGGGTTSYDIYLGTDNPPTNIVNGTNQAGTTYDPASDLAYSTTHYWRIDAINAQGTTTGDVWSFTTENDPNYGGGGAGSGGYYFANSLATGAPSYPSYSWIDITTTGTPISNIRFDDATWGLDLNTLGFSFTYFGTTWGDDAGENLYICSNGWMRFDVSNLITDYSNEDLPTNDFDNGIMPFWDDLDPSDATGSNVYYELMGDGTLVVEYYLVPKNGGSAATSNTFEVILYPVTGNIKFQYLDGAMLSALNSSTVGVQGGDGNPATDPDNGYVRYLFDGDGGPLQGSGLAVMFGTNDGGLPVELRSFTVAVIQNELISINWTTQSETNNIGWNLYRSETDDMNEAFQINSDMILGAGTTTEPTEYTFIDEYEVESGETYWYWLESRGISGITETYDPISLTIPLNEEDPGLPDIPEHYGLFQNYPNPFNPDTIINFNLKEDTPVTIKIYNMRGELVRVLVDDYREAGYYSAVWDVKDEVGISVSSGIYFYKMKAGKYTSLKKMMLVK